MDQHRDETEIARKIDAYLKGKLSEEEVESLWVELLKDPDYLDYLETELGVKSIVELRKKRESDKKNNTNKSKSVSKKTFWPVAAVLAALIGLIGFLVMSERHQDPVLNEVAVSHIVLADNLEAPDAVRSGERSSSGSYADSVLRQGLNLATGGNYEQALLRYAGLIENSEDSIILAKAHLNRGIIQFNLKSYSDAARAFRNATSYATESDILMEKSNWYLANSYIRMDSLDKAGKTLQKTAEMQGFFKKQSEELIGLLNKERNQY